MSRHAALLEGLNLLLPSEAGRRMLRAMLLRGDSQTAALGPVLQSRDLGMRTQLEQAAARAQRQLLHLAVADSGYQCDPAMATTLRTARVREQARAGRVNRLAGKALAALTTPGIRVWALKGIVLANRDYPDAGLRHTHDLDLLVDPRDLEPAVTALAAAGFRPGGSDPGRLPARARLLHPSGFPLELHTALFPDPTYGMPLGNATEDAEMAEVLGQRVGILSREMQFLQILGLAASTAQRHSLRWVTDSHFLLHRASGFRWDRFLGLCESSRLALPASVMLRYLASDLAMAVPQTVLDRVDALALAPSPLERDLALAGARAGYGDGMVLVRNARSGWKARLRTTCWVFFPSRAYLRHTAQAGYGRRALSWAGGALRRLRPSGAWPNQPRTYAA